jgi:hypothetical protein
MSGLGVADVLILAVLYIPVIILIIAGVSFPIIVVAIFIKYKLLRTFTPPSLIFPLQETRHYPIFLTSFTPTR